MKNNTFFLFIFTQDMKMMIGSWQEHNKSLTYLQIFLTPSFVNTADDKDKKDRS